MPTVKLSPIFNSQIVDENGAPAVGWKIRAYVAGSSTNQPTFTDSTGTTPQSNPIIINALGFPTQGQIWLVSGVSYKLVLADANNVIKLTVDNVTGVNDSANVTDEWGDTGVAPTYISASSYTVPGDQTTEFHIGRRQKFQTTAGPAYGRITASVFTSLTTVTVKMDGAQALDAGLNIVQNSILRNNVLALPERIATTTGVVNAYVATVGIARLVIGDEYKIKFAIANDGALAPTLNLDSTGAFPVLTQTGAVPVAGALNGEHKVRATTAGFVVLNPNFIPTLPILARQWVQYGPLTTPTASNPTQPDLIQQSQIGNLLATGCILKCSLAPTLFSAANGYNADGSDNNLNWLATADISVANLTASSTCYIWVDPVAKSAGFVTVADTDQPGGAIPVTNNKYTYDYSNKKMYLGNGTTAAQVNRAIVAEIDTSATAITGVRVRPYKGDYEGDFTATLPAAGVAFSRNHNFGTTSKINARLELECTTNDNGWVVGDRMDFAVGTSANLSYLSPANITKKRNVFTDAAGSGTAWIGNNPTSGNGSVLTLASWKWRFVAECRR